MAYTTQQIIDAVRTTLMNEPTAAYEDVLRAASGYGVSESDIDAAYNSIATDAFTSQGGKDYEISEADLAGANEWLRAGMGLEEGLERFNSTQGGYNYDTQDVTNAYREAYGRNPTQEEYVAAMASMGLGDFDLGIEGDFSSAQVASLESDPYAGRYASYNPYGSPDSDATFADDVVNVSTNVLGHEVQYINPVTQKPVVASFENGQLVVREGEDTLTGDDAAAAVGLAMATGGMDSADYRALQNDLRNATSMDDIRAAFSTPQATITLDPQTGSQLGVGKSLADQTDPFSPALFGQIYSGLGPKTSEDVATPENFNQVLGNVQQGVEQFKRVNPSLLSQGAQPGYGGWNSRVNVNQAGGPLMGAGNADYNSDLIKSLRQESITPFSNNPGFQVAPNMSAQPVADWSPTGDTSTFNPEIQNPRAASEQEIADWNAYQAYRTNTLNPDGETDLLSLQDWLDDEKPDGKPKTTTPQNTTTIQGETAEWP